MKYYAFLNSRDFLWKKAELDKPPIEKHVEVSESVYNEISIGWRYVDGQWAAPEPPIPTSTPQEEINEAFALAIQELAELVSEVSK